MARDKRGIYVTPRVEYHEVQGAYVDKSSPPDPFIASLRQEIRAFGGYRCRECWEPALPSDAPDHALRHQVGTDGLIEKVR